MSRQLTAREMADQFVDAGVVAVVTGPAAAAAAVQGAKEAGVATVVVHGVPEVPEAALPWQAWAGGDRTLPAELDRPARPLLVYTSGTTGKARGTQVAVGAGRPSAPPASTPRCSRGRSGFPPGPHLVVRPAAAQRPAHLGAPPAVR